MKSSHQPLMKISNAMKEQELANCDTLSTRIYIFS